MRRELGKSGRQGFAEFVINWRLFVTAALACGLLTGLLSACAADLDTVIASEEELAALLPAQPDDDFVNGCAECAFDKCSKEREACEADARCAPLLDCRSGCSDPACYHGCRLDFAESSVDVFAEKNTEYYGEYYGCVFREKCSSECNTGKNFQCVGNYSWSNPGAGGTHVRISVMTGCDTWEPLISDGEPGYNVSAHGGGEDFVSLLAEDVTDGFGRAELKVPAPFTGYIKGWRGDLERPLTIEDAGPHLHYFLRPFYRDDFVFMHISIKAGDIGRNETALGVPWDPTKGEVMAFISDCLLDPAPGIVFDFRPPANFENATGYYGFLPKDPLATETFIATIWEFYLSSGGFVNVNPGGVSIEATRASDGVLVAKQGTIIVEKDSVTLVYLSPMTRK